MGKAHSIEIGAVDFKFESGRIGIKGVFHMGAMVEGVVTQAASTEETMGKVVVEVELFNLHDEESVRQGQRKAGDIRCSKVEALVDTGSTLMSLPQEIIDSLGIPVFDVRTSRFANGQTAERKIYAPLHIRVMGRDANVATTAAHPGTPSLLGQIPLEGLDLLVDPKRQRLIPGHSDSPNQPVIENY